MVEKDTEVRELILSFVQTLAERRFEYISALLAIRQMDRRIIESDIRFRLDGLFREAGIVIAFPRRDVHLASKIPVQLQIMGFGKEGFKK